MTSQKVSMRGIRLHSVNCSTETHTHTHIAQNISLLSAHFKENWPEGSRTFFKQGTQQYSLHNAKRKFKKKSNRALLRKVEVAHVQHLGLHVGRGQLSCAAWPWWVMCSCQTRKTGRPCSWTIYRSTTGLTPRYLQITRREAWCGIPLSAYSRAEFSQAGRDTVRE